MRKGLRGTENIDDTDVKILYHIAQDNPAKKICDWLDVSDDTIYRRASKLKDAELLDRPDTSSSFLDYRPSGKGWELLFNSNLPPLSLEEEDSKYIRGHYFTFTFRISDRPEGWEFKREKILKDNRINYQLGTKKNNFEYLYRRSGDKIILSTKTVRIQIKEIIGEDPEQIKWKALKKAVDHISNIEERFDINCIKTPKMASFKCNTQHLARVRDELATYFAKNEITFKVFDENDDLIFVVDQSKGKPEFEAVHPQKAVDNLDNYKEFIRKIGEGDITAQDIEENKSTLNDIESDIDTVRDGIGDLVNRTDYIKEDVKDNRTLTKSNSGRIDRNFKELREHDQKIRQSGTNIDLLKVAMRNQSELLDEINSNANERIDLLSQNQRQVIKNQKGIAQAINHLATPWYVKLYRNARTLGAKIKEKVKGLF